MQFASFADFLAMGGYAFYVWVAFGVTLILLLGLLLVTRSRRRHLLTELRRKQARESRRMAARSLENTL
ncbi:MAG: heme exporter protein CcmD [Aeromonas sp.]